MDTVKRSLSAVESAEAASSFLLNRRRSDGLWEEFDLVYGPSDEWVSAYVALALAGDDHRGVAQSVIDVLWRRSPNGEGWAFDSGGVPDADSSAWVCRLAHIAGRPDAYSRGIRFIRRCLQADGGVATYDSPVAIRSFLGSPPVSLRGWCSSHVCVTAATALLPEIARYSPVRDFLRNAQQPDGSWRGYWWTDAAYATWLAADAVRSWGAPDDLSAIERAALWAVNTEDEESPFGIACRILAIGSSHADAVQRLVERLIQRQRSDGSWDASARLRLPPPQVRDAESIANWERDGKAFGSVNVDHRRVYTTATALRALCSGQLVRGGL